MHPVLRPDFSTVTEQPAQRATRLQLAMLSTRYAWAAAHAVNKDVVEIACGAGLGLGWIARRARSVEAGDLDTANCRIAEETYDGRDKIRVRRMNAIELPFSDQSRDLVVLFEAIYYLPDAEACLREARRVLRPGGTLLIATVNCEWSGFNPSPFHTRYFSALELKETLSRAGFAVHLQASFREPRGIAPGLVGAMRRAAVAARMIPPTMAGKAFLKRLFYGSLEQIPRELSPGRGETRPVLSPIEPGMDLTRYRTIYAEARRIR